MAPDRWAHYRRICTVYTVYGDRIVGCSPAMRRRPADTALQGAGTGDGAVQELGVWQRRARDRGAEFHPPIDRAFDRRSVRRLPWHRALQYRALGPSDRP